MHLKMYDLAKPDISSGIALFKIKSTNFVASAVNFLRINFAFRNSKLQ